MRVAVTAGYSRSQHACAVITLLERAGHEVVAVNVVRAFTPKRARGYVRQLGVKKAAARLQQRYQKSAATAEVRPVSDFCATNKITSSSVTDCAEAVGATITVTSNLNADDSLEALRGKDLDLIIYAGGGILRQPLLDIPKIGTLNAHAGPLPDIRGMNSSEWALLKGQVPEITTILVERGVDTGPIVRRHPIDGQPAASIEHLRGLATVASIKAIVADVDHLATNPNLEKQDTTVGRQYFVMAQPLVDLLDGALAKSRQRP